MDFSEQFPDTKNRHPEHLQVIEKMEEILSKYKYITTEVKYYGVKYYMPNWLRFDLLCYKNKCIIMRINRWAHIARNNPIVWGVFDDIGKVISKIYIYNTQTIENKGISSLIWYIYNMPKWIGAFD